jgi:hypothetical protein
VVPKPTRVGRLIIREECLAPEHQRDQTPSISNASALSPAPVCIVAA